VVKDVQHGAFEPGCLGESGQHGRRHRAAAERSAVGVPPGDGCIQLALRRLRAVRPGEADRGQQQRLTRIGEQLDNGLAARNGGCQAQVEQCGAARDVDGATVRVAVPQRPCRVGMQLDSVSVAPDPEPPGLSVVHRWRCHGGIQQVGDHLLG
jgi:hypothetical protein